LGFTRWLAGLDGRTRCLGFSELMATVLVRGEPGRPSLSFTAELAGLDGRTGEAVATVFVFIVLAP
jgi:hypothetical protein